MTRRNNKSNRFLTTVLFPAIGLLAIPMYQYGRPWVDYHQQNLVVYEFRINSESIPIGANMDGQIEKRFVHSGQKIEIGDVVAKMDTCDLEQKKKI